MKRIPFIASLVLLTLGLSAQSASRPGEPKIIPQPGSPAMLSPGTLNHAPAAMLRNRSGKTIIAYRIGWLDAAGSPTFGKRIDRRIGKGERVWINSRDFAVNPTARFFIAEVAFGDGTNWKADLAALRRQATKKARPTVPV